MGTGPAGAIAVTLGFPARRVLRVCGDGGFLMNVQELETGVRLRVPVVALVWRDDGYGVIRWNELVRFGRTMSVDFGNPDLVALAQRSEEHTSELQSQSNLVCRLLLEKKKKKEVTT